MFDKIKVFELFLQEESIKNLKINKEVINTSIFEYGNLYNIMMNSNEIRESFINFFENKGHKIVPSAPMVIKDDPTLMFTNAGMNQFKDIILGNTPIKYSKVADSQKCLRVSGKHNDLEEVGHDTYHHTMFEMLGNWSFGDYFKKEAIGWAWEYLTEIAKLDKDRLYATVFEGDADDGLPRDNEAAGFWAEYLSDDKIINGSKADNFWEMGDQGPCGPCSELHIDLRSDEDRKALDGASLVNQDHPQVVEIWNLVFMEYNRRADGTLVALPAKVIDTGMGFERLCMAVQNKISNYDTDVFQIIIGDIAKLSNYKYGDNEKTDIAMRVIADHIRTIAFSITDGQLPSNAKAGYVIRRILRRAVRYGYTFLNMQESFMYKLIPALIRTMGVAYPELEAQKTLIEKVIKEEEESFLRTLETGIKLLDKLIKETKSKNTDVLNGADAFVLYDTFGFPLDLTELILRENGMEVDHKEFDSEMQKQRERARNAAASETGDWVELRQGEPVFVGYDLTECDAEILRYRKVTQTKSEFFQIVLDRTPFYPEMGGQVGDSGWLITDNEKIEIFDTKRENNLGVHLVKKLPSDPTASFIARINHDMRRSAEANHTATHLLHHALRELLGEHVEQKGSLVSPAVLRFDFAHYEKLSDDMIREVEQHVNAQIRANIDLDERRDVSMSEAKEMGAMALFGEKYGDEVRVIKFGDSVELCGGTHLPATGNIGIFRIISESSIAAGIRRIEALTGTYCEEYLYSQQDLLQEIRTLMNNAPDITQAIKKFFNENQEIKKELDVYVKERVIRLKDMITNRKEVINGINVFSLNGPFLADVVKEITTQIRAEHRENMVFIAGCHADDRPMLTVAISDDLVKQGLNASNMIKEAAKHIQGGGGGQPQFATAGGRNLDGLTQALESLKAQIK